MLELILVMALTGILLAAMAPMMLKSKTDEKFLQKVQEEIESRQNAARWYYNDYNAWPGSAANLKAPVPNTYNPAGTPYLDPGCSETSAFGTNYVFSSTSNTFTVSVDTPADLAARLGSRLPNAVYTTVSASVTNVATSVPKPGNELVQDNFQDIKVIGIYNPGAVITKPTCPAGKTADIYVSPTNMRTGTAGTAMTGAVSSATDNGNGTWTVNAQVKDVNNTVFNDSTAVKLQVISVCR